MNKKFAFFSALCIGLIGISTASMAQPGFAPPELALHEVRDNVYLIRSGMSGNVTVLVSDEGVALVDDKFEGEHEGIMDLVRGITDKPVLYVINTHLHGDHTGGNALMQALGTKVIASDNARRIMAETQDTGLPNLTFDDHMRIYLGDMPIDLHYFGRGHTDGDIVIYLPEERLLVAGDIFALWGPFRPVLHYGAGGSLRDWPRTLNGILQLDFDTVIPGHSGITDRAMVESYRDTLIETGEMIREMNRQMKTRDEIREMLETQYSWGRLEMALGLDGAITEMR